MAVESWSTPLHSGLVCHFPTNGKCKNGFRVVIGVESDPSALRLCEAMNQLAACGAIFLRHSGKLEQKQSDCFNLGSNPIFSELEARTPPSHYIRDYSAFFL